MSPLKQITSYTVERSHLISSSSPAKSNLKMSNKRRLNFDDTDTERCLEAPATAPLVATSPSGSDPEVDLFDMDFSNMDFLGENFSISELLVDFDLGCEGSTLNAPMETVSGYVHCFTGSVSVNGKHKFIVFCSYSILNHRLSPEPGNGNLEPDQTMSEYTTTVNEVIKGKDMITQGGLYSGLLLIIKYAFTLSTHFLMLHLQEMKPTPLQQRSLTKCIPILSHGTFVLLFLHLMQSYSRFFMMC